MSWKCVASLALPSLMIPDALQGRHKERLATAAQQDLQAPPHAEVGLAGFSGINEVSVEEQACSGMKREPAPKPSTASSEENKAECHVKTPIEEEMDREEEAQRQREEDKKAKAQVGASLSLQRTQGWLLKCWDAWAVLPTKRIARCSCRVVHVEQEHLIRDFGMPKERTQELQSPGELPYHVCQTTSPRSEMHHASHAGRLRQEQSLPLP
eukprot:scaffold10036_cov21-Tisochrysis_lutea.AAC.2